MSLLYGVYPILDEEYNKIETVNESSLQKAKNSGLVKEGDKIVLVSGVKAGKRGTNTLLIKKL